MNYAWTTLKALPQVEPGSVIEDSNFSRMLPHTPIFDGVFGLTFRRCNLNNCDVPPGSIIEDCQHGHMEWCSNEHPWILDRGFTPACPENCAHVISTDTITIDGVVVAVVYHYQNRTVA